MTEHELPAIPLDLGELLATLSRHQVEYTVIGGVAIQIHGHRRTTMDLDVIPDPAQENLERLARALVELRAHPRDLPGGPPTAEHLASAPIVPPLTTSHGELHILRDVPGAPAYDALRSHAFVIEFKGITLAIAGIDDLVAMKRATGRPADQRDIAALTALSD